MLDERTQSLHRAMAGIVRVSHVPEYSFDENDDGRTMVLHVVCRVDTL